jgi:hypothetical protein
MSPHCLQNAFRAALLLLATATAQSLAAPPDDFPRYIVPGHESEMDSLRNLYWQHYAIAGPQLALWDEWLVNTTIWPARGTGAELDQMRRRWRSTLAARPIDADGYVLTQQHDGPAHAEGWPFPTWMQAGGIGWHFRPVGVAGYEPPPATPANWKLNGAQDKGINDRGWRVELVAPEATATTPQFAIDARIAPWLRLNWWATGLGPQKCYIEWTTKEEPRFTTARRVEFSPVADSDPSKTAESRTMISMVQHPEWKGTITGLRIGFANSGSGAITIKSFHTACDTRHNVNNLSFIRGCCDYFLWTGDVAFVRENIARIRIAMRFVEREFHTRERKCIYTTWPGHEGRSGVVWNSGKKQILPGQGIGSNYWDLLPFGGEDALATVYYYNTLQKLADLEEAIQEHAEWNVTAQDAYNAADLRAHATEVKSYFDRRFWNNQTGRFGTVDLDGQMHDYGFTFLNNEAVVFGIASPSQERSIYEWMSGQRVVPGDTSTGDDIYHWLFAPRATTRRNTDYYFWGWSNPESVPWGGQVQDGGAVLAWSYYDLMARLKTAGPDAVAPRLQTLAKWFDDTQREGGYRAYYAKDPSRGSLQGGGTAGGLGIDQEFVESVMATNVMLYGLLGFHPTVDGFSISPQLPKDWPELTITRVHLRDQVLAITATRDRGLKIVANATAAGKLLVIEAPPDVKRLSAEGVNAVLKPTSTNQ